MVMNIMADVWLSTHYCIKTKHLGITWPKVAIYFVNNVAQTNITHAQFSCSKSKALKYNPKQERALCVTFL